MEISALLLTSKSYPLSVRSACHRLFSSHVLEHFLLVGYAILARCVPLLFPGLPRVGAE